jgi:hypothetical protein
VLPTEKGTGAWRPFIASDYLKGLLFLLLLIPFLEDEDLTNHLQNNGHVKAVLLPLDSPHFPI